MEKTYECLKETLEDQIKMISKKGDKITQDELMSLYYALKAMDKIDKFMEEKHMSESSEYKEGYHDRYSSGYSHGYHMGYSKGYDDGRSGHMERHDENRSPVTGKYIDGTYKMYYGDHMYGHSIKDRMIAKIETMYDEAKSEHEKQVIANTISRIQNEVQ